MRLTLPSYVANAIEKLNARGFEAYAVGGCTRDLLRGEAPNDYDIATSALPEEILSVFEGERTIPTGLIHGTVTLLSEGGPLEITTYRIDGGYTDGRHPDAVAFSSSFREDAKRRDFTVNAMAIHPDGTLLDYFGGQADLERKIIRAVGDPALRFEEDALRILRAMRFASVLDFEIEEKTAEAMHVQQERLRFVSAERIREELTKALCGKGVLRIFTAFSDIVGFILPELVPSMGFDQKSRYHLFDVYTHTLHAVAAVKPERVLRLTMLLHDVGKPSVFSLDEKGEGHFYGHGDKSVEMAAEVLRRLRFDNATADTVLRLIRYHDLPLENFFTHLPRLRGRHGDPFLLQLLEVKRADNLAQNPAFATRQERLAEAEALLRAEMEKEPPFTVASLAVNGKDLLALGLPPSPQIGSILSHLTEAVLDGRVQNEKEALLAYFKENNALFSTPLEIERKLLIAYPDTALLEAQKGVRIFDIEQTYLYNVDEALTERVRLRREGDSVAYFHTVKRRLSALTAEEQEAQITKEEFEALLSRRDKTRATVQKRRYALPYGAHTLEIDIYPQWKRQAVLEVELASEKERFSLPPYLSVLRDVTADKRYKNVSLSREFPDEEE